MVSVVCNRVTICAIFPGLILARISILPKISKAMFACADLGSVLRTSLTQLAGFDCC